jgi:hypothetical protein
MKREENVTLKCRKVTTKMVALDLRERDNKNWDARIGFSGHLTGQDTFQTLLKRKWKLYRKCIRNLGRSDPNQESSNIPIPSDRRLGGVNYYVGTSDCTTQVSQFF